MTRPNYYRKDIGNCLLPYFRKDKRLYLLVCDMGFGVTEQLRQELPKRVINCGIMEQSTVGIAAGMSLSGLVPVVYSIANFLVFRALEQMRNDVALQKLNVKFIGTGVNDYFLPLGFSHCCGRQDIDLMKLIDIKVYDPYAVKKAFSAVVKEWICAKQAGYLRI